MLQYISALDNVQTRRARQQYCMRKILSVNEQPQSFMILVHSIYHQHRCRPRQMYPRRRGCQSLDYVHHPVSLSRGQFLPQEDQQMPRVLVPIELLQPKPDGCLPIGQIC